MSENTPASSDDPTNPTSPNKSTTRQPPTRSDSSKSLNPRSCVTCRRRKVRCDKNSPCSNCVKQGIECVFPGPGRAPRKPRKAPDSELLSRLRRLEGVVKSLGLGEHVEENSGISTNPPRAMSLVQDQVSQYSSGDSPEPPEKRGPLDTQIGRLVINEGRSRYVTNQFWATMGDEIAEMRDFLDAPSSEGEEDSLESPSQTESPLSSHQSFLFGYSSANVNLKKLHPSPSQIFILWEVYKENIDPLVRILHRPSVKDILINASSNPDALSKSAEALLFAIYFGAVVSLEPSQCQSLLGESKQILVNRFRFATEQALARAGFLNSSSLMVLQAFVFFLICVRYQDDTRLVWALGGLAIHLSQALGVHRDGTNFGLTPFETEMRRRLWWHISLVDTRSSEDQGTDSTFSDQFYDTRLPMNINDDDIYPDMKEWPTPRQGFTEMTFCLARFELSMTSRRLNLQSSTSDLGTTLDRDLERKEKIIDEAHQRIEERYLQYCDMNIPIQWVTATVGRLVLAKMWLMAHHPAISRSNKEVSNKCRDRLFTTSVEVIEFGHLLEQSENTAKWGWLFRTYMQWHAVTFVLAELCVRPPGPEYDRAWRAVESVYNDRVLENPKNQRGMLWKPMRQLMARAQARRMKLKDEYNYAVPTKPSERNNPRLPNAITSSAEVFGLDLDGEMGTSWWPQDMSGQDVSMSQSGISESDLQGWLASGPIQLDPNFPNWSGWTPNIQRFDLEDQRILPEFPITGQQQWP